MNSSERYSRQRDVIPRDRLEACPATVIGVGAIGRQVALQLTAIGIDWLQLVDFDSVEESNVASQGYHEHDVGRMKVHATAEACWQINGGVSIHMVEGRFRRSQAVGDAVFVCVDSIDTRKLIWQALEDRTRFHVDARMSAETLRVLTVSDGAGREHYPTTLFTAAEAYAGACTAKSTIYCASVAAGVMLGQFTKFLRGLPVEADVQLNLLTSEMTVACG